MQVGEIEGEVEAAGAGAVREAEVRARQLGRRRRGGAVRAWGRGLGGTHRACTEDEAAERAVKPVAGEGWCAGGTLGAMAGCRRQKGSENSTAGRQAGSKQGSGLVPDRQGAGKTCSREWHGP